MKKGEEIYNLMSQLFPICRSITGDGVRDTFKILQSVSPILKTYEIPSGEQVFDWTIPKEWNIVDAYIEDSSGRKIIDFKDNNLHVVSYSYPIDEYLSIEELKKILHTYPPLPDAIPYVTSYYNETSGFCISQNEYDNLKDDTYHAVIKSELKNGHLTYGDIIIPGTSEKEVLFSTYICHPSMANNELSGPCIAIYLADALSKTKNKYTYRFVFVPETIGSIAYISHHFNQLKENVIAGFNLSCLGDDKAYTYVASRNGNTLSDFAAKHCMRMKDSNFRNYSFINRGSDERQYNMPGVDIPVCGLYRSKSNEYDEYHTSADNMSFVSPDALNDSFDLLLDIVFAIEHNEIYQTKVLCEPQLGKRNLYPKMNGRGSARKSGAFNLVNFLAYADGVHDLISIADTIGLGIREVYDIAMTLLDADLIEKKE